MSNLNWVEADDERIGHGRGLLGRDVELASSRTDAQDLLAWFAWHGREIESSVAVGRGDKLEGWNLDERLDDGGVLGTDHHAVQRGGPDGTDHDGSADELHRRLGPFLPNWQSEHERGTRR